MKRGQEMPPEGAPHDPALREGARPVRWACGGCRCAWRNAGSSAGESRAFAPARPGARSGFMRGHALQGRRLSLYEQHGADFRRPAIASLVRPISKAPRCHDRLALVLFRGCLTTVRACPLCRGHHYRSVISRDAMPDLACEATFGAFAVGAAHALSSSLPGHPGLFATPCAPGQRAVVEREALCLLSCGGRRFCCRWPDKEPCRWALLLFPATTAKD